MFTTKRAKDTKFEKKFINFFSFVIFLSFVVSHPFHFPALTTRLMLNPFS
jgi:hypothetical protein